MLQAELPLEFTLRDGTTVVVRPILPEDKTRLRQGFHRLSPESRFRRFMATLSDLSDEQLAFLTEIDYDDHMAWIALDPGRPGTPGLGVARYVRIPGEPEVAEAAVTVIDEYQGRGLGTILLGLLGLSAMVHGVRTFRAYVLEENQVVLDIFRDLGATVRHEDPGVVVVEAPVPVDPADLPDTPTGRVFKAVARRMLPPIATPRLPKGAS